MCKKLLEVRRKYVIENISLMCAIRDQADSVHPVCVEIEHGKNLVAFAMTGLTSRIAT